VRRETIDPADFMALTKELMMEEDSYSLRHPLHLQHQGSSNTSSPVDHRRETIDTMDMEWLKNETSRGDASSIQSRSHIVDEEEHDVDDNATVNTMDLMGAVEDALDDAEHTDGMEESSFMNHDESILPLNEILNRHSKPQSSELPQSQQSNQLKSSPFSSHNNQPMSEDRSLNHRNDKKVKRKSRSPGQKSNHDIEDSAEKPPASQRSRIFSPHSSKLLSKLRNPSPKPTHKSQSAVSSTQSKSSSTNFDSSSTNQSNFAPTTPPRDEMILNSPPASSILNSASMIANSVMKSTLQGETIVLKSCFSAKKSTQKHTKDVSASKSVVFGSPKVAEFNKHSPTTNFTPMNKHDARRLFPVDEIQSSREEEVESSMDEITADNDRILEEWDRLTNASETGSDDDESHDVMDQVFAPPAVVVAAASAPPPTTTNLMYLQGDDKENMVYEDSSSMDISGYHSNEKKREKRRRSKLQPLLDLQETAEEKLASFAAAATSFQEQSNVSEMSHTVELPATLNQLMAENEEAFQNQQEIMYEDSQLDDKTEEIENNLQELMNKIDMQHSLNVLFQKDQRQLISNPSIPLVPSNDTSCNSVSEYNPFQTSSLLIPSTNTVNTSTMSQSSAANSSRIEDSILPISTMIFTGLANLQQSSHLSDPSENNQQPSTLEETSESSLSILKAVRKSSSSSSSSSHDTISNQRTSPHHHVWSENEVSELEEDLKRLIPIHDNDQDISVIVSNTQMTTTNNPSMNMMSSIMSDSTIDDHSTSMRSSIEENNEVVSINDEEQQIDLSMSFVDVKRKMIFGNATATTATAPAMNMSILQSAVKPPAVTSATTTTTSTTTNNPTSLLLLHRLQSLNDDSHRHTLAQCRTPRIPNRRQSLEAQHQSFVQATTTSARKNAPTTQPKTTTQSNNRLPSSLKKPLALREERLSIAAVSQLPAIHEIQKNFEELVKQNTPSTVSRSQSRRQSYNNSNSSFATRMSFSSVMMTSPVAAERNSEGIVEQIPVEILALEQHLSEHEEEMIHQHLCKFFSVMKTLHGMITMNMDATLQDAIRSIAKETYHLATKSVNIYYHQYLQYEHHLESSISIIFGNNESLQQNTDTLFTLFYQQMMDIIMDHIKSSKWKEQQHQMHQLEDDHWDNLWMNFIAMALFDLSEILEQQKTQQPPFKFFQKILHISGNNNNNNNNIENDETTRSRFHSVNQYVESLLIEKEQQHEQLISRYLEAKAQKAAMKQQQKAQNIKQQGAVDDDKNDIAFLEAQRAAFLMKIAHRLSYYHIQVFTEEKLSLIAYLSEQVTLQLHFQLQETSTHIQVTNTNLELTFSPSAMNTSSHSVKRLPGVQQQHRSLSMNNSRFSQRYPTSVNSSQEVMVINDDNNHDNDDLDFDESKLYYAQENAFVSAYYTNHLLSTTLNEENLSTLDNVSHIPILLDQLTGHILIIRRIMMFLRILHRIGGLSMLLSDDTEEECRLNMDFIDLSDPISMSLSAMIAFAQQRTLFIQPVSRLQQLLRSSVSSMVSIYY
jgi:hypothetical protein